MEFPADPPPPDVAVALKEWAGIVRALALGEQTILLRKGGIDEGPGGFRPEHEWFWLYPTAVHQAQQGLKPRHAGVTLPPDAPTVPLGVLAQVRRVERLTDLETVLRLDPLHEWTEETIATRFRYRQPGLWLMVLRVYAPPQPRELPVLPEHAGCRSWVPLPMPYETRGARPVRGDGPFFEDLTLIEAALDPRLA
jgi:hypothetical protein